MKFKDVLIQSIEASNLAHSISMVGDDELPLSYVNQAFLDQTGYARDEVIGFNCRFLQGEGTDPQAVQKIREAIAKFEPIEIEILNYKKDGTPFWNYLRMAPVFDDHNNPVAFIGIQSDVTLLREQERAEAERQKLEALGRMSANISHEIKNAIQPVKLMSETLLGWHDMNNEQIDKCLDIIRDNIHIADRVTKNTLNFSRKSHDDLEEISLTLCAEKVVQFTSNLMTTRVEFSSEIQSFRESALTKLNEQQLYQVIINIVNNALYALDEKGHFHVDMKIEEVNAEDAKIYKIAVGQYACISFIDDGSGMDEKTLSSVFDPFFSTKPYGEGTGLGLSISYRLIKNWGGTMRASSQKNKGSTFSILLPLV